MWSEVTPNREAFRDLRTDRPQRVRQDHARKSNKDGETGHCRVHQHQERTSKCAPMSSDGHEVGTSPGEVRGAAGQHC